MIDQLALGTALDIIPQKLFRACPEGSCSDAKTISYSIPYSFTAVICDICPRRVGADDEEPTR